MDESAAKTLVIAALIHKQSHQLTPSNGGYNGPMVNLLEEVIYWTHG